MTAPSPPDVDALFAHGARHRWANSDDSQLDVVLVGDVSLPSGQVVVRDPGRWVQDEAEQREPFSFVARPGDWRVVIAIARWDDSPDPRVPAPIRRPVAVKAEFGEAEVQSWEVGLRPGDELPGGDTEDLPGFGVDGGVGWLLDATDLGFLRRLQQASEDDLLEFSRQLIRMMRRSSTIRGCRAALSPSTAEWVTASIQSGSAATPRAIRSRS